MAKAKKAKKVVSKAKKTVDKIEDVLPKVSSSSSGIRSKIESLKDNRRDASVIWELIKNGSQSDDEIKAIINSKNFYELLGEIS